MNTRWTVTDEDDYWRRRKLWSAQPKSFSFPRAADRKRKAYIRAVGVPSGHDDQPLPMQWLYLEHER